MERNYIKEGLTKTIKIDKSKRVSIYIWNNKNEYIFDYSLTGINTIEVDTTQKLAIIDFLNVTKTKKNKINSIIKKVEYIKVDGNAVDIKLK